MRKKQRIVRKKGGRERVKKKKKKALPEQLEDSFYPDDYWLDKEDGQEVSEPLPDGENPVSGKLRKEPMVTGYEALERQKRCPQTQKEDNQKGKESIKTGTEI